MLFASESQQSTHHFASEIEDLRTIARMHNFAAGSPECLAALPMRLSQDARLRSDITEFIRSLQTRDHDLALPEVLSLLLTAIGGSSALQRNRDLTEPIDLTGGFLASLGGWPGSDVEPLTDLDNPPDHDPRLDLAAAARGGSLQSDRTHEIHQGHSAPEASSLPDIEEVTITDHDGPASLSEITQALARLERGNLELRLHLDSIDQRICRMEPLLETSPVATAPEPPPDPPSPSARAAASFESPLLHRGSDLSGTSSRDRGIDPALGVKDSLDVLKEQRRISLTSNFPELHPHPALTQAPAASQTAARPAMPASPAAVPEPISPPRTHQPRRDRFAAAREIPGTAPEFDPLYSAPEAALPSRATLATPPPEKAAAVRVETWTSHQTDLAEQTTVSPFASIQRTSPAPVTSLPSSEPLPPAPDVHPASQAIGETPVTEAASAPPFSRVTPSNPSTPLHRSGLPESQQPRRSLWVPGVLAASVLGAAGILYFNGLPSTLTELFSGSSTAVSSGPHATAPQTASDASPSGGSGPSTPRTATSVGTPAPSDRVLGARDSFTPTQSIERISGPTFVPGGVMDGYLVAAPRPEYPRLASLAGIHGKISMEAMISKEGQVEALKVLGGPQLLREAATNAVRQWQYRPFEVKGRPVEVRTIIRVDVASRVDAAPAE